MLNKIILKAMILSLLSAFLAGFFAQPVFADHPEEEVLPEAGFTPASPFHIFERFGDWARLNVLTFGSARKAEVKVRIAEKRLAELKAVVEAGAESSVVESAEGFVNSSTASLQNDAETLDVGNQDASALIEKLNSLSLKQQAVLERVFEKAPEQAKEAITRAIENSRKGLEKAEEVLQKQIEKKLIKEEKAKEILEKSVLRLKEQVERRSEHLDELIEELGEAPPELKEQFEAKLKHLEDRLVNIGSREELKNVKADIKDELKDTASAVLEFRKRHQLQDDAGDELLRDIQKDEFDVAKKAREMIGDAEEEIAKVEELIKKAESQGVAEHENVKQLMDNARKHLAEAKAAFERKEYGHAFGQAMSARRNIESAKRFMKFVLEDKDEARDVISDAKEEIAELESKIEKVKAETGQVPEAALKMLEAAREQLRLAEAAFSEGNLERASNHANAAKRMADRGKDILGREKDVFEKRKDVEEKVFEQKLELEEGAVEIQRKSLEIKRETEKKDENIESLRSRIESVLPVPSAAAPIAPSSVKVRITSVGFEPREVKMQKGGTVIWVNESGSAVWPASAVHPTHDVYPQKGGCIASAFDACRRVENGGTYEFRFDHMGTWKYHDHLNASRFGSVTVTE